MYVLSASEWKDQIDFAAVEEHVCKQGRINPLEGPRAETCWGPLSSPYSSNYVCILLLLSISSSTVYVTTHDSLIKFYSEPQKPTSIVLWWVIFAPGLL